MRAISALSRLYTGFITEVYLALNLWKRLAVCAFAILLVILGSIGCDSQNPYTQAQPSRNESIFPLKVGNSWELQTTYLDTLGNPAGTSSVVMTIVADTLLFGSNWYKAVVSQAGYPDSWKLYIQTDEGIRNLDSGGIPGLYLKYPATVGDSYMLADGTTRMTVLATDTAQSVPAGDYSSVIFRSEDTVYQKILADLYFSYGTGWIRTDLYNDTESGRRHVYSRSELRSVILK